MDTRDLDVNVVSVKAERSEEQEPAAIFHELMDDMLRHVEENGEVPLQVCISMLASNESNRENIKVMHGLTGGEGLRNVLAQMVVHSLASSTQYLNGQMAPDRTLN